MYIYGECLRYQKEIFFCQEKPGLQQKEAFVKTKGRNTVPVNWIFKSKEKADGLIFLKSKNEVKGYMQVPGVDFKESFSTVTLDTSTGS